MSAKLEILQNEMQNSLMLEKARAEVAVAECHKRFEAFSTKALTNATIDDSSDRANAVIKLGNMTANRITEVHQQDWPQAIKADAIAELLKVRQQVLDRIRKEC